MGLMPLKNILVMSALAVVLAVTAVMILQPFAPTARAAGLFPYQDRQITKIGQSLYQEYCASCHGANLEGEPNWRDRDEDGYLPAPPHDPSGHTWHHPDEQLFLITKHGTEKMVGGGYKSRMAGFGDSLSDEEIIAILAYIKSTWPPDIIARHNKINGAN